MVPRAVASPSTVTFTVNSLGDAPAGFTGDPGYTLCRTNPGNSTCTLRAALMNANRYVGGGATIIIPAGMHTLSLTPLGSDDAKHANAN